MAKVNYGDISSVLITPGQNSQSARLSQDGGSDRKREQTIMTLYVWQAGMESSHYGATLCLSGVHPATPTTDGMSVCLYVRYVALHRTSSEVVSLTHTHLLTTAHSAAGLFMNKWRRENLGMKEWEQRMRRKLGCIRKEGCDCSRAYCVCTWVFLSTIFDPDQLTYIHGSLKVVVVVGGGQLKMLLKSFN